MFRKLVFFFVVVLAVLTAIPCVDAQVDSGAQARPRITQSIDETNRVALKGNTHPAARAANDRGAVPHDLQMDHILLQLQRPAEQEQALQEFISGLETEGSPNFHQWITAQEFGEKFGLAKQDLDTITRWLESHGFRVNLIYPSGMVIDFSGTAGQVREAFDRAQAAHVCVLGIVRHHVGFAVGGHHAHLVQDAPLFELARGLLH